MQAPVSLMSLVVSPPTPQKGQGNFNSIRQQMIQMSQGFKVNTENEEPENNDDEEDSEDEGATVFYDKTGKQIWRCDLCLIDFDEFMKFHMHTRGMVHLQKHLEAAAAERPEQFPEKELRPQPGDKPTPIPKPLSKDMPASMRNLRPEEIQSSGGATGEHFCKLCKIYCTGIRAYQAHMEGQKHAKAQKRVNDGIIIDPESATKELPALIIGKSSLAKALIDKADTAMIGIESVVEIRRPGQEQSYTCELCVSTFDQRQLTLHIGGIKHRRKYLKLCYPRLNEVLSRMEWGNEKKTAIHDQLTFFAEQIEQLMGRNDVRIAIFATYEPPQDLITVMNVGANVERAILKDRYDAFERKRPPSQVVKKPPAKVPRLLDYQHQYSDPKEVMQKEKIVLMLNGLAECAVTSAGEEEVAVQVTEALLEGLQKHYEKLNNPMKLEELKALETVLAEVKAPVPQPHIYEYRKQPVRIPSMAQVPPSSEELIPVRPKKTAPPQWAELKEPEDWVSNWDSQKPGAPRPMAKAQKKPIQSLMKNVQLKKGATKRFDAYAGGAEPIELRPQAQFGQNQQQPSQNQQFQVRPRFPGQRMQRPQGPVPSLMSMPVKSSGGAAGMLETLEEETVEQDMSYAEQSAEYQAELRSGYEQQEQESYEVNQLISDAQSYAQQMHQQQQQQQGLYGSQPNQQLGFGQNVANQQQFGNVGQQTQAGYGSQPNLGNESGQQFAGLSQQQPQTNAFGGQQQFGWNQAAGQQQGVGNLQQQPQQQGFGLQQQPQGFPSGPQLPPAQGFPVHQPAQTYGTTQPPFIPSPVKDNKPNANAASEFAPKKKTLFPQPNLIYDKETKEKLSQLRTDVLKQAASTLKQLQQMQRKRQFDGNTSADRGQESQMSVMGRAPAMPLAPVVPKALTQKPMREGEPGGMLDTGQQLTIVTPSGKTLRLKKKTKS